MALKGTQHSAAWSLHVAWQSWRHEEHLGGKDHAVDVDPHLDDVGGSRLFGSPGNGEGRERVPRSPESKNVNSY